MFETIEELECVTGNRCIEGVFFLVVSDGKLCDL